MSEACFTVVLALEGFPSRPKALDVRVGFAGSWHRDPIGPPFHPQRRLLKTPFGVYVPELLSSYCYIVVLFLFSFCIGIVLSLYS